jgi:hypothetical protein
MDSIIILFCAVLTIVGIRKILCAFPGKYFSVQDIVTSEHKEISLCGFLLRFPIIFVFSLLIAFFYKGKMESIIVYSLLVSFLLVWPFILNRIIYRNENEERNFPNKLPKKQVVKYLIVYSMYTIICVLVSLSTIPIYNLINHNLIESKLLNQLYEYGLRKYLSLNALQQAIVNNIISEIILLIPVFFIYQKLHNFCKKYFK